MGHPVNKSKLVPLIACMLSHFQLSATLWTVGFSVRGLLQARIWIGLPCLPPGDLPDPGIEPASPALQANSLTTEPPGNVNVYHRINVNAVKNQGSQRKRMQKQIGCQI